jgi:FKBP-type peptidyl-prolyl cis-trans isomerase 2
LRIERTLRGGNLADVVEKGDIIYLDFDAWLLRSDGESDLFDTTREDVAKEHDHYHEEKTYAEIPLIVGEGRVFEGLDEALEGAVIGEATEAEIPPDKAAGERDPKLVELHSIREFRRKEIEPKVGMEVELGGKWGTVTAVTAGRVRVDFNNPLAGRTLRYDFTVNRRVEEQVEKIRAIIEMDYGSAPDFEITLDGDEAEIVLPDICKYDESWFVNKYRVVADMRAHAGVKTVRFVETYVTKKEPAEEEAPTEERAPEELPPEEEE